MYKKAAVQNTFKKVEKHICVQVHVKFLKTLRDFNVLGKSKQTIRLLRERNCVNRNKFDAPASTYLANVFEQTVNADLEFFRRKVFVVSEFNYLR